MILKCSPRERDARLFAKLEYKIHHGDPYENNLGYFTVVQENKVKGNTLTHEPHAIDEDGFDFVTGDDVIFSQ